MSTGNGRPSFQVVYSELVRQQLKQLLQSPDLAGREEQALKALKAIERRLRKEPRTFGEPEFSLASAQLEVRTAVEPPLAVTWAVHKHKAVVFVKTFTLLEKGPP